MLQISPAVTVTNVPGDFPGQTNNYILFPDSEDKNRYYALAEKPNYLANGKEPSFNLTWFFGTGVTSGAICTMTVALPMPNMTNPDVKQQMLKAVKENETVGKIAKKTVELCAAMDKGDAAQIAQLKQELGFSDDDAAKRKSAYNSKLDWQQFLPSDDALNISPIPFTSGTVKVRAFASEAAVAANTPEYTGIFETTPSLFNSNAAVVTFNLNEQRANLFWQALGGWPLTADKKPEHYDESLGGSSVITVAYQVAFDGMLPQAKATVTLKHSLIEKVNIEQVQRNGSWGRTYTEDVMRGKDYDEDINSATEIVLPAVATKEDKDSVQKLLTDWAGKQLDDMGKKLFESVPLDQLNADTMRSFTNKQEQSRTYTLTQAVSVPKNPQAMLPKIDGIVGADELKKYFQLINLNDKPFIQVGLTVRPPNATFLKDHQVESFVVTQLSYAGEKLIDANKKEVTSIEFAPGATPATNTYTGTFGKETQDKGITYGYRVLYSDGTESLEVPAASQKNDNYLDLGGIDLGVLSVSLNSIDLPWDVITSARVLLTYDGKEYPVTLTKSDKPLLFTKPFGKAMDKPLTYQLSLKLTDGSPLVADAVTVPLDRGRADISLRNPLGNGTNRLEFDLDPGVSKAQLRVDYEFRNGGPSRHFTRLIELDASKDGGVFGWTLPSDSDHPSKLIVVKARATKGAVQKDIADLTGGELDPVGQAPVITVYEDRLDSF